LKKKKEISVFLLAIPAFCDITGTTLLNFALLNMASSVFQMFRGGIVLITALMSILFLKKKQYRHHLLGIIIVFSGMFLVGLAALVNTDSGGAETKFLGILLLLLSLLFSGFQFVIEEKFLGDSSIHPLKVVGWEGIWGSIFILILLPIFQFIPCSADWSGSKDLCAYNEGFTTFSVEDSIFALKQMGSNGTLMFFVIASTFSIAFFNFFGISITKYASSPQRAVLDNSRTILVWLFFMIYQGKGHETFKWLQLVGFFVLIIGSLIYNEIVELPFFGFDQYTKKAIKEREENVNLIKSKELSE